MPKPSGSVRTAVPENRFGSWPFSTLPHVTGLLHLLEINILPDAFWRTENTMF